MKNLLHTLFHAIFWIWNLIFLVVVYLGILPLIGLPLVLATLQGQVPIEFAVSLVGLVAVPTLCTAIGFFGFRRHPLKLIRLFYGVEAPLFLLCLLRLFVLRELTPASTHILVSVGICISAFLAELLFGYAAQKKAIARLQLLAHALMLLVGLYTAIVLLFYAVPLSVWLIQQFFAFRWVAPLQETLTSEYLFTSFWWLALLLVLLAMTCSLFIAMPSAMAALYIQSGQRIVRAFQAQSGRDQAWAGVGAVSVLSLVLFMALQHQPQVQAFTLLQRPAQTVRDRQELLARSATLRAGLVNAYLSNYRYLSSEKDNNHIQVIYQQVFGLPEGFSQALQRTYNGLMSPFLYHGLRSDVAKAETLYEQFFDAPIQKAEQAAVNHALQSTANRDEAKAGLLNFNQQKVWLRSQQVTIQPQGDWANVELYEVYENQTPDQQEVFYSFSLPESAVMTGLWLGESSDRKLRFPFVVAPRGAAQQVYNAQVQVRVDPALLEQVGPRHYRLRAFPVPPKSGEEDSFVSRLLRGPAETPTRLHLWLTYRVMQQKKGWPMPQLGEQRNLFWTKDTQRILNGKRTQAIDAWLPAWVQSAQPYKPVPHQTTLPEGYQISARPLTQQDYTLPKNQRFAVVLDSSRSMAKQVKALQQTFSWLKAQGFANTQLADNDADLYLTASAGAKPQRLDDIGQFDPKQLTFYGTISLQQMLQQFNQLRLSTPYNGILLLTDEGSYELSDDDQPIAALPAPLWMVHLGALPPAYDDGILQAIADSNGGVGNELPEVLRRLATKAALGPSVVSVADGYAWRMDMVGTPDQGGPPPTPVEDPFAALAARQMILGLSQQQKTQQLAQLNVLHQIASTFKIVTPYSSMIVLVNDEQREALKQAESQSDRFDREVESGKEQLTQPLNPLNVAVPESSPVWGLAVAALLFFLGKRRLQRKNSSHPAR